MPLLFLTSMCLVFGVACSLLDFARDARSYFSVIQGGLLALSGDD